MPKKKQNPKNDVAAGSQNNEEKKEENIPKALKALRYFFMDLISKEDNSHKICETIKVVWMLPTENIDRAKDLTVMIIFDDTKVVDHITRGKISGLSEISKEETYKKFKITIHPVFYNLSDYWELIRHGSPVTFSEIQEGMPIYDPSGFLIPLKKLIEQGRIPGTKESMKAQIGRAPLRLIRIRKQFKLQIAENMYNAVIDACQAPLMLVGVAPPAQREVASALDNHFVKKGKLEPEYVRYVEEIVKYFKDIEHGEITDITGHDLDRIVDNGIRVIERAEQLMEDIENEKN